MDIYEPNYDHYTPGREESLLNYDDITSIRRDTGLSPLAPDAGDVDKALKENQIRALPFNDTPQEFSSRDNSPWAAFSARSAVQSSTNDPWAMVRGAPPDLATQIYGRGSFPSASPALDASSAPWSASGGDPWAIFPDAPPELVAQIYGRTPVANVAGAGSSAAGDDPWAIFPDAPPEAVAQIYGGAQVASSAGSTLSAGMASDPWAMFPDAPAQLQPVTDPEVVARFRMWQAENDPWSPQFLDQPPAQSVQGSAGQNRVFLR
jgi:hypothetical protein